jgi:hypothetical protein
MPYEISSSDVPQDALRGIAYVQNKNKRDWHILKNFTSSFRKVYRIWLFLRKITPYKFLDLKS